MTYVPMAAVLAASLFVTGAALAQTAPQASNPMRTAQNQSTDGRSPSAGLGSATYKQRTEGSENTPVVGPASGAYKQQSDGESPTVIGPGSGAYKQ